MSVKLKVVPVTPYQQNCSILMCSETRKAAIVDPGGDLDRILAILEGEGGDLEKIFITHGHLDHCAATQELRQRTGVPVEGPHEGDRFWIEGLPEACQMSGFPHADPFEPDRWLVDGDTIRFGDQELQVLHCPGHTPGHLVFYHSGIRVAWVGDVLFQGSIGRTDFPGGDHDTLINAIRGKLWPLGDDVQFVPGHGPMSTFGDERRMNAFVADSLFG